MKSKKLWFKAKRYGWGWSPATWEGWLILGIYIFYVVYRVQNLNQIFELIPATVVLLLICYFKGEKPRWRWGK